MHFNKIINQFLITVFLSCFLFYINPFVNAQKQYFTIDDIFTNPAIYPEYIDNIKWLDNISFTWLKNDTLYKSNVKNNKKFVVTTLERINEHIDKAGKNKLQYFPPIEWINNNTFYFSSNNIFYLYNCQDNKLNVLSEIDKKAENIDINNKSLKIAYTIGNNLFISDKDITKQVTQDGKWGIVNGKSVHRDEFGIEKGTFWSPSANYLAFYRMDETMVTDYPLVIIDSTPAILHNIKYPMAGQKSHHVTLGVYNTINKNTLFLKTGEPAEQYLTNITWSPDEKFIYIAVLNREQNHCKINKYDISNGNFICTLFEEKDDKYVEPLHPLYFLNNSSEEFIWLSRRDGFTHAYLYNVNGTLPLQITKGKWEIDQVLGFDNDNKNMFFVANKDNPIGKDVYSVNLKNKQITRISKINGTHEPVFSPDFKYLVDQFSNCKDVVNRYDIYESTGKLLRILLNSKNPLVNYDMGETSIFTLKADDGSDLYCRLIKPANMVSGKKYPVFYYVYGGPHSQLVTNRWLGGAGLFQNYMAQQGYVVFTMDNRGTSRRGADFEQATFRNLGKIEMADQLQGIDFLKSQDYVDVQRIGLHGWSFGGFMTLTLTLKNPGLFKVSIAGGPVTDWKYYEVMYGERYMDTPQENPEGYKNANIMNYAKNLDSKLMIIHGAMDSTVVWQQSLNLLQKFIKEGKSVDYFVYPDQPHNMKGKSAMHLYKKIEQYFKDYL